MCELTFKIIVSDNRNNIIDTTIPTPEQEEEVYLFLKQCEKLGPPWI